MDFIKNHTTQWKFLWSKRMERITRETGRQEDMMELIVAFPIILRTC